MTIEQLLDLCKRYDDLGWAVQEQLHAVAEDPTTLDEHNPAALKLADERFLSAVQQLGLKDKELMRDVHTLRRAVSANYRGHDDWDTGRKRSYGVRS